MASDTNHFENVEGIRALTVRNVPFGAAEVVSDIKKPVKVLLNGVFVICLDYPDRDY